MLLALLALMTTLPWLLSRVNTSFVESIFLKTTVWALLPSIRRARFCAVLTSLDAIMPMATAIRQRVVMILRFMI